MASRHAAAVLFVAVLCGCGSQSQATHRGGTTARAARRIAVAARQVFTIGSPAQHRTIDAIEIGNPSQPHRMLIVGCIHGNEPAGIAIARQLITQAYPPSSTTLWVMPDLNPDGVAEHTRQNADAVDLNRNFPWHWRPLGSPGALQ